MMWFSRALALAGALTLALSMAHAQQYPSGHVQGNSAATAAPPRASDIRAVLHRALGCSDGEAVSVVGGTVACIELGDGVVTFLATPSSANLRAALTDETGSGAAYFQGGDLGTPSAGLLSNATGLPVSSGISGLGAGIATWLATPSSANLAAALTDETGSGAAVFAASPTLVSPDLGTPSAITLSNATGLPTAGLDGNAVTNAKLAQMAQATVKGRAAGAGTGDPVDLTPAQATAILANCVGDAGSGGTKGLVPPPGAGDAAVGRYLKADCTWAVPAGGGGGGMTDAERQNFLLDSIYLSKALGDFRRSVRLFATGFKAASDGLRGIDTSASANYDTTNAAANGYVVSVPRLGLV